MRQSHNHKEQDLFNNEERNRDKGNKEEEKKEISDKGKRKVSSEIKNAHAAGTGALERSKERQIEDSVNNSNDEAVY
jgi:hypothetical protein